jgi:hypothetical protein
MTNTQYRNKGIAAIRNIPMPVQINGNNRGRVSGYTMKKEWMDYSESEMEGQLSSMLKKHQAGKHFATSIRISQIVATERSLCVPFRIFHETRRNGI